MHVLETYRAKRNIGIYIWCTAKVYARHRQLQTVLTAAIANGPRASRHM